jgi:uncharacterized protein YqjF (DUF2071 family)
LRPFLTAYWRHVVAATYEVEEERVARYVPPGVELDRLHGVPRLSLVAFEFEHTRVHGLPVPGCVRFAEINLRFYVRCRGERGVVFIRELVPRRLVALVARVRYNEPYERTPMRCGVDGVDGQLHVWHRFGPGLGSSLEAWTSGEETQPPEDADDHWLTHHTLGIGRARNGGMREYRVEHPLWALRPVRRLEVDVDFERVYGPEWAFLSERRPGHVTYAAGSHVAVYPPGAGG